MANWPGAGARRPTHPAVGDLMGRRPGRRRRRAPCEIRRLRGLHGHVVGQSTLNSQDAWGGRNLHPPWEVIDAASSWAIDHHDPLQALNLFLLILFVGLVIVGLTRVPVGVFAVRDPAARPGVDTDPADPAHVHGALPARGVSGLRGAGADPLRAGPRGDHPRLDDVPCGAVPVVPARGLRGVVRTQVLAGAAARAAWAAPAGRRAGPGGRFADRGCLGAARPTQRARRRPIPSRDALSRHRCAGSSPPATLPTGSPPAA